MKRKSIPIKELLPYIKRHPVLWAVGLVCPTLLSLFTGLIYAASLELYTQELQRQMPVFSRVVWIMVAAIAGMILLTVLEDICRYVFTKFSLKSQSFMRDELFASMVMAKYLSLASIEHGELQTRYNQDTTAAVKLFTNDLFGVVYPIINVIGYFIALCTANAVLALFLLALVVGVVLINAVFVKRFAAAETQSMQAKDGFINAVQSAIHGKMSLRMLGANPYMADALEAAAKTIRDNETKKVRLSVSRALSVGVLTKTCSVLSTPIACILAAMGFLPLSAVVFITQICSNLIDHTGFFGEAVNQFGVHAVSHRRLKALLMLPKETYDEAQGAWDAAPEHEPIIACRGVSIAYGDTTILRDVNFQIHPGEIVVLSGPSGSGKSSLIKALLRVIDANGSIQLCGRDIADLSVGEIRQRIAYAPEHSDLFSGTVAENITNANPSASAERIAQELQSMGLVDPSFPGKDVGVNGSFLSGGQKQRVSNTRAFLKDAQLYILDEPTAALDEETEQMVLGKIEALKKAQKAVLLISHRESTRRLGDREYRIEDHTLHAV
jgi:ATP-binding cassette subfamily B protein